METAKTADKISVIIPVYNTEKYLKRCLDSVVGQSHKNLEIICVDDGSTDSSPLILEEYARRDSRVRVLSQPNSGQGTARNYGIDEACGDYITFLDSDDWCDTALCEKLLREIIKNQVDFVMCATTVYNEKKGRTERSGYFSLRMFPDTRRIWTRRDIGNRLFDISVTPWGKLFSAAFLRRNKIRFVAGHAFEDNGFFMDVFFAMKSFSVLKEHLVFYRASRKNSDTDLRDEKYLDFIFQVSYAKEVLERSGVYAEYEAAFLQQLFFVFESRIKQIKDTLKDTFYRQAREFILSVDISPALWEKSFCARENYRLYKECAAYDEWLDGRHQMISFFFRKKIKSDEVSYYLSVIPLLKKYINGDKRILGIPVNRSAGRARII